MKTVIHEGPERLSGGADAAVEVVGDGGETLARCSLWTGSQAGIFGHFEAQASEAAAQLFGAGEERLREAGCTTVTGPMDGDTWHHYRLVTRSDGRSPFFLEPQNPEAWPGYFLAAGWRALARYTSSEIQLEHAPEQPALGRVAQRLRSAGVTVRNLRPESYAEELRRIHQVSLASFHDNFLYSPISLEDFSAMYLQVEPLLAPEFSLLAEDADGRPVGFVFALPEPADPGGIIIVKTLAALPDRRFAGLGSVLVDRVHRSARELGFKSAIHALQHQDNRSLKISSRHAAKVFREYTLYEKPLVRNR